MGRPLVQPWRSLVLGFCLFLPGILLFAGGRQSPQEEPIQEPPSAPLVTPAPAAPPTRTPARDLDGSLGQSQAEENLASILRVLDDLILSGSPGSEVIPVYSRVRQGMNSGDILVITRDEEFEYGPSVLSSVYFAVEEGSPGYLVVSSGFFSLTDDHPSLAFGLLVEAMGYASQYLLLGQEFIRNYEHPVERYLYSMDALYLKALFTAQYLSGIYSLSPYEEYLLEGLAADNLSSVSLYFRGVDLEMVYGLLEQANAVRDQILDLPLFLDQIEDLVTRIGDQHRELFPESSPNQSPLSFEGVGDDEIFLARTQYITTVTTGTYIKYGVQIINDLLTDLQAQVQADSDLITQVRGINEASAQLFQRFLQTAHDISLFRDYFTGAFFYDLP